MYWTTKHNPLVGGSTVGMAFKGNGGSKGVDALLKRNGIDDNGNNFGNTDGIIVLVELKNGFDCCSRYQCTRLPEIQRRYNGDAPSSALRLVHPVLQPAYIAQHGYVTLCFFTFFHVTRDAHICILTSYNSPVLNTIFPCSHHIACHVVLFVYTT